MQIIAAVGAAVLLEPCLNSSTCTKNGTPRSRLWNLACWP